MGKQVKSSLAIWLGLLWVGVSLASLYGGYNLGLRSGSLIGYDIGKKRGLSEGYATGQTDGREKGYAQGYTHGKEKRENDNELKAYEEGAKAGFAKGKVEGAAEGYSKGKEEGSKHGFERGKTEGYAEGKTEGYKEGYSKGDDSGFSRGRIIGKSEGVVSERNNQVNDSGVLRSPFKSVFEKATTVSMGTKREDVQSLLGTPDSIVPYKQNSKWYNDRYYWVYGTVKIYFDVVDRVERWEGDLNGLMERAKK